jgi:hypothetical protein
MKSYEEVRTFKAPLDEVRRVASDALATLGAEVEISADGTTLSGRTGWTLFSFGENVEITLDPHDDGTQASVSSAHRLRSSRFDLGSTNRKNVGSILASMAGRLRA